MTAANERPEAWGPIPDLGQAAEDADRGFVIARFLDATEHHGDRVIELWADDVHRSHGGGADSYIEHVDDEHGGWELYELRRLPNPRAAVLPSGGTAT